MNSTCTAFYFRLLQCIEVCFILLSFFKKRTLCYVCICLRVKNPEAVIWVVLAQGLSQEMASSVIQRLEDMPIRSFPWLLTEEFSVLFAFF